VFSPEKKSHLGKAIMNKILGTVFLLVLFSCAGKTALVNKTDILQYITIVENDPLSADADRAYSAIMRFTEKSKDVTVVIDAKVLPWMGFKYDFKYTKVLLGSFIAGNIKPQIENNKNEDDAYAGLLLLFEAYNRIKKADPDFAVQEIEKQQELQAKDELRQYLVDLKNKDKKK
jgi:hypothetical protein